MRSLLWLCRVARTITDEELAEAEALASAQLNYAHPLKMGTAASQHKLGMHNMAVIAKVRELRVVLTEGEAGVVAGERRQTISST